MSNTCKAQSLVMNAYQMYTGTPDTSAESPFPMYSYEKPGRCFWNGFVERLLDDGATIEQVQALLRHKHMRWMFDAEAGTLEGLGKQMAEGFIDVILKERIGSEVE